jgi:hypothetical protein
MVGQAGGGAQARLPHPREVGPGQVAMDVGGRIDPGLEAHAVQDVLVIEVLEALVQVREVEHVGRAVLPHRQVVPQRFGDRGRVGVVGPEAVVGALAEAVVQLDEVDGPQVAVGHGRVELAGGGLHPAPARQVAGQHVGGGLDQHDAGRFQRLQETAGQAHRDAVLDPVPVAMTDLQLQQARRQPVARLADIAAQDLLGALVRGVAAGIDIARAPAVGQADVPGPAGLVGGGDRGGRHRGVGAVVGNLQGQGPIDEQGVALVDPGRAHGLTDQGAGEARAVDIEVGRQVAVLAGRHRGDRAVVGLVDRQHVAQQMLDARGLADIAQQGRQLAGVEMIGIGHRPAVLRIVQPLGPAHRLADLVLQGDGVGERDVARLAHQPVGRQVQPAVQQPGLGERVVVAAVDPVLGRGLPVDELDALLEGRPGLAHEPRLVDADRAHGVLDGREGALAHPDDADLAGLDQGDAHPVGPGRAQAPGEVGGGHPAGRAAADDQDVVDRPFRHPGSLIARSWARSSSGRQQAAHGLADPLGVGTQHHVHGALAHPDHAARVQGRQGRLVDGGVVADHQPQAAGAGPDRLDIGHAAQGPTRASARRRRRRSAGRRAPRPWRRRQRLGRDRRGAAPPAMAARISPATPSAIGPSTTCSALSDGLTTPRAPRALRAGSLTAPWSTTIRRRRVVQASTDTRLAAPPRAATKSAPRPPPVVAASAVTASSASRPGVFRSNLR